MALNNIDMANNMRFLMIWTASCKCYYNVELGVAGLPLVHISHIAANSRVAHMVR